METNEFVPVGLWNGRPVQFNKDEAVLLSCPACKSSGKFVFERKSDGHCSYIVGYVACEKCAFRTRHRTVDGYYGCKDTVNDVINDWNARG